MFYLISDVDLPFSLFQEIVEEFCENHNIRVLLQKVDDNKTSVNIRDDLKAHDVYAFCETVQKVMARHHCHNAAVLTFYGSYDDIDAPDWPIIITQHNIYDKDVTTLAQLAAETIVKREKEDIINSQVVVANP